MKNFTLLLVLIYIVVSCSKSFTPEKYYNLKDYNMVSTPNNLDNVGLVFAVDKKGKQIRIIDLGLSPKTGLIKLGTLNETRKTSLQLFSNFLKLNKSTNEISFQDSLTKKVSFLVENAEMNTVYLGQIEKIYFDNIPKIKDLIKKFRLENNDIYLIIETIRSKSIKYKIDKGYLESLKINSNIGNNITINPKITVNNDKSYNLDFNFDEPLVIFYKTYRVEVENSFTGNMSLKLIKKNSIDSLGMKYLVIDSLQKNP